MSITTKVIFLRKSLLSLIILFKVGTDKVIFSLAFTPLTVQTTTASSHLLISSFT